jgi:uncharacterized protein
MSIANSPLDPTRAFLGVGWAFPPHVEASGATAAAAYEEDIRQCVRIILGTNPGERVMRPDFGAGLKAFLFEPINATSMAEMQVRVEQSLNLWEPRIDILSVRVSAELAAQGRVMIEINYRVRATNAVNNLVYPFYLQEGSTR